MLLLFFILAAGLRLVWPADMEYKGDEFHIYHSVRAFLDKGEVPRYGIQASINIPNPGMSVWPFLALGWLGQVENPVELSMMVRFLNIAAFLYFIFFLFKVVPGTFRDYWFWAYLLAAVNPFMVIWQRKIWPPSLFPFFSLLLFTGFFKRDKWWGAFLLGFIAALVGQIQLAAFFFTIPFLIWTFLFYFTADDCRFRWQYCLLGGLVGCLPMATWLLEVVATANLGSSSEPAWVEVAKLRFWRYWFTEPFAAKLTYSLGDIHFQEFLAHPVLGGKPRYFVGAIHGFLAAMAVYAFVQALVYLKKYQPSWRSIVIGSNENQLILNAAFWGFGIFLSLITWQSLIYRHYLNILFPLTFVYIAFVAYRTQRVPQFFLGALVIANFLLSVAFVEFIHVHGGTSDPRADYGKVYRLQE